MAFRRSGLQGPHPEARSGETGRVVGGGRQCLPRPGARTSQVLLGRPAVTLLGQARDPLTPQGECVLPSCCPAGCLVVWSGGGGRRRAEREGVGDKPRGPLRTRVEREARARGGDRRSDTGRDPGSRGTASGGHALSVCPHHLHGDADLL